MTEQAKKKLRNLKDRYKDAKDKKKRVEQREICPNTTTYSMKFLAHVAWCSFPKLERVGKALKMSSLVISTKLIHQIMHVNQKCNK